MLAEALELLEAQPAGPELVSVHAYMAGRLTFAGKYREAVAEADRGLALASELGLPEPGFVLHWRGMPRCELGEADGVEDVRRSLQLALEQGLGRETAVIYGNLAGVIGLYEGPRASLDMYREAIAFCERRGITEVALQGRSAHPSLLAELGQTEQALAEAGPIADRLQTAGDMSWLFPRALQLRLLAETGMAEHAPDSEPLLAAAREIGLPDFIACAFAAAAQLLLTQGQREHAHALLQELDQLGPAAPRLSPACLPCSGPRSPSTTRRSPSGSAPASNPSRRCTSARSPRPRRN